MDRSRHLRTAWFARAAILFAPALMLPGCGSSSTAPNASYDSLYPKPAPDRPLIAYFLSPPAGSADLRFGIHVLDTSARTDRLVLAGSVNSYDWIPGSDTLVVCSGGRIMTLDLATLRRANLAIHESYNCSVSSDGAKIAFDATGPIGSAVFVLDRRNGTITNITPDSMVYQFPAWVGPTDQLVVVGTSPTASGLYFLTPSGAPRRRLTSSGVDTRFPTTSASGDSLLWAQGSTTQSRQLVLADTASVTQRNLAPCFNSGTWLPLPDQAVYNAPTSNGARLYTIDLVTGVSTPLQ